MIVIDSMLRLANPPEEIRSLCVHDHTFTNPRYETAIRLGKAAWFIDRQIEVYREDEGRLILPRGYVADLLQAFPELRRRVDDRRTAAPAAFPGLAGVTLRPYQGRAVSRALLSHQGIVQAPTGAGKTIVGLELIRCRGQRALILVHSTELARQWQTVIRTLMGIETGMIGGGSWAEGELVTVAMLQTLHKNPERTRALGEHCGLVLVDEAHHIPAATFAAVMEALPCRHRYGLTATPHRRDGLHVLIHRVLGPVLAKIDHSEVESFGGIVTAEIEVIRTDICPGVDEWGEFVDALIDHPGRNARIADVARQMSRNLPTLILTDRVRHAETLAGLVGDCVLAHGSLGAKARREAFAAMETHPLTVGTFSLLGEGLDVSRWGGLVLATPVSSRVKTLQAIGRVIRPHEGKSTAHIIDFLDGHPFGASSFRNRAAIYRERGYPVHENRPQI